MTDALRIEQLIDAPPDAVFGAFTTPGGQEAFYGTDDPGWIVESECDLRVGGRWTVTFGPSRDHLYRHESVFEVIDAPRRIVLATTEHRPDRPSFAFSVEFTFQAQGGRTLMTMVQSGFPTPELRDEHGRGVPDAVARLARYVCGHGVSAIAFDDLEWQTRPHEPGEPARHTAELSAAAGFVSTRANLWRYEPGAKGRRHVHARQEESFVVLSGTLTMIVGEAGERVRVEAPGLVHVPAGTPLQTLNAEERDLLIYAYGAPPDMGADVLPDLS